MTRAVPIARIELTNADWQTVHQAIDEVFDDLEARIQQSRPELASRGERVQAARFWFNYRAFDPPAGWPNCESLVVGIRFEPERTALYVTADICTEESGRIIYQAADTHVAAAADEVAAIGGKLARQLAVQWQLIVGYFEKPAR